MKFKGFTLTELAIVIAVIATLIIFRLPRLSQPAVVSECSTIKDLVSQLNSAQSIYTDRNTTSPKGFPDFVTTSALLPLSTQGATYKYTLSVLNFGTQLHAGICSVSNTTITCANAFKDYIPIYHFKNGEITLSKPVATKNNHAPLCR